MEQNTESSLKNDSEYTLEYFRRFSGWGPLEKNPENRPRIIYLKNDYLLLVTLKKCLQKAQTKIQTGDMGYRSPHLSHAKRALYHLSYIPSIKSILDYQYCLLGLRYISENRSRYDSKIFSYLNGLYNLVLLWAPIRIERIDLKSTWPSGLRRQTQVVENLLCIVLCVLVCVYRRGFKSHCWQIFTSPRTCSKFLFGVYINGYKYHWLRLWLKWFFFK